MIVLPCAASAPIGPSRDGSEARAPAARALAVSAHRASDGDEARVLADTAVMVDSANVYVDRLRSSYRVNPSVTAARHTAALDDREQSLGTLA